tara:strand:- start:450 stop:2330 length:1881 start_codon:yes stop_codon:yes gene_type:complete
MILDNFYELLETINVLLFKKKLIEGNKKKKKKKKKSSNLFAPKKKSKKDKAKDKKKKEKNKLKKAKKDEKDARQSRNKKRKKQKKAERKAAKTERKKNKHCDKNENSGKCKKSKKNDRKADKKLEKKNRKLTKAENKLDKKTNVVIKRQDNVRKANEKITEIKNRRKEKKISNIDSAISSSIVKNQNNINDLQSRLHGIEDTVNTQTDSLGDVKSSTAHKLGIIKSEATQAGREAGRDAGDSAGEYAGSIGANDFIKDSFGKELDEMADDFVRKSATDAGVKATKDYLSSGLYIKCSPVQDSSVDNKRSNVLLYDDSNIDSKISKSTDVPDYGTIILIISGMGILIYIINKIYPSMKGVNILPSSLRTVTWLTSIYLLVFGVMCIYIVDSLNILADYSKQVVNIIKKDIKNDRTLKKIDDVDVKEIKQTINKSGLTTILNGLGLNNSDINKFANSINNLIKGNDVSFDIEKRYGFFENETYEKMALGAFFAYYVLIMCYMYSIYLNWKNISKSALNFLTILVLTYWGIFAVIGMLIYYVWFNVYNKDSINSSANKWKGITSNNDLEKKYVNRLIVGTLCISAVVFDPFLKRLIKLYIKKPNNNEGELNNNELELNNVEQEVNNNQS